MTMIRNHWRQALAVLPLPMLALAASYGVYSFALLFVPFWVAVVQAAAFELTYIGLAVLIGLDERQRHRARLISIGAVAVSILYNSLAGLFHRQPALLEQMHLGAEFALAVLHGLPLALVAYFVADLLLHRGDVRVPVEQDFPAPQPVLSMAREASGDEAFLRANIGIAGISDDAPAVVDKACPRCHRPLTAAQYGAARRWGYCKACKE